MTLVPANHKTMVAKMQKMAHWFQHRETLVPASSGARCSTTNVGCSISPPMVASRGCLRLQHLLSPSRCSSVVAVAVATRESPPCSSGHRRSQHPHTSKKGRHAWKFCSSPDLRLQLLVRWAQHLMSFAGQRWYLGEAPAAGAAVVVVVCCGMETMGRR